MKNSPFAVVNGSIEGKDTITSYLTKAENKKVKVVEKNQGKSENPKNDKNLVHAILSYESLKHLKISGKTTQTIVAVDLHTGRKHQIRAQLSHLGFPIVGDIKYNAPQRFREKDISLHSLEIVFKYPGLFKMGKKKKAVTMRVRVGPPMCWSNRFNINIDEFCKNL